MPRHAGLEQRKRLGLLDPTDHEVLQRRPLAPRRAALRGTVGGVLDNRQHTANVLLERVAARRRAEHGMAEALHRAKFSSSRLAEGAMLDALAERCDFVVAAIGD